MTTKSVSSGASNPRGLFFEIRELWYRVGIPAYASHSAHCPWPIHGQTTGACSYCGSRNLTRRGTRMKKLEIVQLWRCASCKRTFTPGPAALRNKTYPLRVILAALSDYDLGYSLQAGADRLKKKTGRTVSPSTISAWLNEYHQHCSYRRLRRGSPQPRRSTISIRFLAFGIFISIGVPQRLTASLWLVLQCSAPALIRSVLPPLIL